MDWGFIVSQTLTQAIAPIAVVYCLAAIGLNVHFGYTGLLNFGQSAFLAVAAYGLAVTVAHLNMPFWLGIIVGLVAAVLLALVVPVIGYFLLRRFLPALDAAALAATYGSVSAVLFACALNLLSAAHLPFSGYMNAALAAMEAPAIVSGILIYQGHRGREDARETGRSRPPLKLGAVVRLAFGTDSLWLLLGSLIVGILVGESGWRALKPCFGDLFQGVLCFFLLDQGSRCAFRLDEGGRQLRARLCGRDVGRQRRGRPRLRQAPRSVRRRCVPLRRAARLELLPRGAGGDARSDSGGESRRVRDAAARGQLPVQRRDRPAALPRRRAGVVSGRPLTRPGAAL